MKKMMLLGLGLFMLVGCGGSKDTVSLKEQLIIEYGSELKTEDLTDQEGITLKDVKEYDAKKIGEQKITAIFTTADEEEIEQEITLEVKDTKAPEITFKSETVEIALGDAIDTAANIESVKDPVDGDIVRSDDTTITENGYFVMADIKSEAGEYTVNVVAYDLNGNNSEKSYKLIIKEKTEENNQPVSSNQGGSSQAPTQNGGTQSQVPASNGSNASSGSQPAPSQPNVVCPNGNAPKNPDLPCDAFISGSYNEAYRDASGNIMAFSTAEEAYDWAYDVMSNDKSFDIYSSFATLPLGKNDGTQCDGVVFFK